MCVLKKCFDNTVQILVKTTVLVECLGIAPITFYKIEYAMFKKELKIHIQMQMSVLVFINLQNVCMYTNKQKRQVQYILCVRNKGCSVADCPEIFLINI